jgi:peptide chain release factor subunit 1
MPGPRCAKNSIVANNQRLRDLAALRPQGHKVLSLYLNLDPSEFPTPRQRSSELQSLLDTVERELRDDSLPHQQRDELRRDVERIRAYFEREFDASGTRGVAVFAASGIDLFDVHRLSRPVRSEVTIDDSPFIEPLTSLPGEDGYCVLLVNRQIARILCGDGSTMRELVSMVDDVHRWHDQGGWSQARFQRGIQKETKDHLKHACEELFKLSKRGMVRRLIIGTPDEMRGEVEHTLHSYLRDRIAGWLDIDIKARPADVAREASAIIEADESAREREWIDRLKSELGRNSRGVAGLAGTLEALNERRVEGLLVKSGFRAMGYASPTADFLSTEPGTSPVGEELQRRDVVIEAALESALEQSAEVVVVRHHPVLDALGAIGAVLRY